MNYYSVFSVPFISILFILLPVTNISGQISKPSDNLKQFSATNLEIETLLRYFTDDSKKLNLIDETLLQITLGDIFWDSDRKKAKEEYSKAIGSLKKAVNECEKEKSKCKIKELIGVSSKFLESIAGKDKQYEEVLITEISDLAKMNNLSERDTDLTLSNIFAQTALQYLETDSKKAFELGILSINSGDGNQILSFWLALSKKYPNQSKIFYDSYISLAERKAITEPYSAIENLGNMIFPEIFVSSSILIDKDIYSNERRSRFLKLLFDTAQRSQNICLMAGRISKLSSQYELLAPAEGIGLRGLINNCKSKSYFQDSQGNVLSTLDDFFNAAEKTEDKNLKLIFKLRAAQIAFNEELYDKSIEILETIEEKERTGFWESLRKDSAVQIAYRRYLTKSVADIYSVLNDVPENLRLEAKISFINVVIAEDKYDRDILYDLLRDTDKENDRFIFSRKNSKGYGIVLVFPYAKLAQKYKEFPSQAFSKLRETIQRWNKANFLKNETGENEPEEFNADYRMSALNLPQYLMESDFLATKSIIADIDSPLDRVRGRFFMLRFLLSKKLKLQKEIESENKKVTPLPEKKP